nr:hypothetical protein [Kibdelosporangium sp. MJ126-NF4]CTQ91995.1 hypothetical protein [Kibdelosporangium sp. MJ126-NF4]
MPCPRGSAGITRAEPSRAEQSRARSSDDVVARPAQAKRTPVQTTPLRANAQGCGSWGVPPVWPGRSHTTACREVGLRNWRARREAIPISRRVVVSFGRSYGRGAPRLSITRPGKLRGLSERARETKCLLCPLLEACRPARTCLSCYERTRVSGASPTRRASRSRPCGGPSAVAPARNSASHMSAAVTRQRQPRDGCSHMSAAVTRRLQSRDGRAHVSAGERKERSPRRTAGRREGNQPVVCPPGWLCSRDFPGPVVERRGRFPPVCPAGGNHDVPGDRYRLALGTPVSWADLPTRRGMAAPRPYGRKPTTNHPHALCAQGLLRACPLALLYSQGLLFACPPALLYAQGLCARAHLRLLCAEAWAFARHALARFFFFFFFFGWRGPSGCLLRLSWRGHVRHRLCTGTGRLGRRFRLCCAG